MRQPGEAAPLPGCSSHQGHAHRRQGTDMFKTPLLWSSDWLSIASRTSPTGLGSKKQATFLFAYKQGHLYAYYT